MRTCSKCKIIKPLEDFPKNRKCKMDRERKCKQCTYQSREKYRNKNSKLKKEWYQKNRDRILKERKVYYQENKERLQAYSRQHAKDNPEIYQAARHRRRKAVKENGNNDLTAEQIKWLFENFPICIYCGTKDDLTIDHIVPISKGGQNTLGNIATACSTCNNKKRAQLMFEPNTIEALQLGIPFDYGCSKCSEVRTDRILTDNEWKEIHAYHE